MNNTALYIITVLIWGSTWIAINFQLGDVAPEVSVVYRFGLASATLFLFCKWKKLDLSLRLDQHIQLAVFGIALFGTNYYFLYLAQGYINSALACIAFSSIMLFNIINSRIWFKTDISSQTYLGGAIGLMGITVLFWPQIAHLSLSDTTLIGLGFSLIATLSASAGNMISMVNQKRQLPVVQSNAWGMLYGTIFMAIVALVQGTSFTFSTKPEYLLSLVYLSLFGSVIAFGCYLTLLNNIGAHKASYSTIMFPAVAVLISTLFEGFEWNIYTVIGFSAIMVGNIVVLAKPKRRVSPAVAPTPSKV
ncbi:EamA family transporter [Thalassotalea sp. LPB0316]|uniref:DMT family transporter n=1 Tax=Thalassotalea sp. LPB0316 TaxID=2769490 RepID=UPI001868FD82|nr:EamA family transporter [Thalassotalea sp. LPB0316]QOL26669.1 EamA family transporter [Thalassotalea sp. LPB0316]